MLVTSPQPSLENLGRYYESEDYISHTDNKGLCLKSVSFCQRHCFKKNKLELINGEQIDKGSILDIGAGTGDFLSVAKRWLEYYR
jgi:hypothetical protein